MEAIRRALKSELIVRGCYSSIPTAILSSTKISKADKIVYAAMLDYLRGNSTEVYPAASRLARETGLNVRTVRRSQVSLVEAGRIFRRERPGRSPAWSFAPLRPGELPDTKTGNPPRPKAARGDTKTGRGGAPQVATVNTQGLSNEPASSGAGEISPETLTTIAIVAQADRAYREVYGVGIPSKWRDKIEHESERGDPAILAEIDASAIRAGQRCAKDSGGTFGLGWVLRVLADRLANRVAKQDAESRSARFVEAVRDEEAAREAARAAELQQQATERLWFSEQPAELQQRYREAEAGRAFAGSPELVDRLAARRAWLDANGYEPDEALVVAAAVDRGLTKFPAKLVDDDERTEPRE